MQDREVVHLYFHKLFLPFSFLFGCFCFFFPSILTKIGKRLNVIRSKSQEFYV